jgi:hypothetical protein
MKYIIISINYLFKFLISHLEVLKMMILVIIYTIGYRCEGRIKAGELKDDIGVIR